MKVKCDKCGGTGRAELSETLGAMLGQVCGFPGCNAVEHWEGFPTVGVTAINNRLEDLRAFGLVRRERRGKSWVYFPISIGKTVYPDTEYRESKIK